MMETRLDKTAQRVFVKRGNIKQQADRYQHQVGDMLK